MRNNILDATSEWNIKSLATSLLLGDCKSKLAKVIT